MKIANPKHLAALLGVVLGGSLLTAGMTSRPAAPTSVAAPSAGAVSSPAAPREAKQTPTLFRSQTISAHSNGKGKKLRINDHRLADELVARGGRLIAAYSSFSIVEVDRKTAKAVARNASVEDIDGQRLILLNARTIDTESEPRGAALQATAASGEKGMHLVHFAAPPRPEWYRALESNGAKIVTYIPHNSYLIYGDASAIARVRNFARAHPAVDWDGPYEASHRLHRRLVTKGGIKSDLGTRLYSIQLVDDAPVNAATIALIDEKRSGDVRHESTTLHYRNLIATLPDTALQQIAARPDVVSIQPYSIPKKNDERQNQIIAGHVTGGVATAPGYLSWLESLGFTQAQFDASGFAVDVTDSGVDNGTTNPNHFALFKNGTFGAGNSRVVYNRLVGTPHGTTTLAGCDGHGNINAHIIGGFSDAVTAPHIDAGGFSYGLGVAPWVRLGSTVIFDPDFYTYPDFDTIQSMAYADGVRISSNSWGTSVSGAYDADSQAYDALVRDAQPTGSAVPSPGNQEMVIIFAAGNDGPAVGSIGSPGTGKNILSVGASENARLFGGADGCFTTDSEADHASDMATFSSRGPTDDARFKPDLVAPGTHVTGGAAQSAQVSTGNGSALACFNGSGVCGGTGGQDFFPSGQSFYTASSGTSHSAPAVAGAAALLRQHFINEGLTPPSPALTKALLMNTSRYLDGSGAAGTLPSNAQGMGEVNLGDLLGEGERTIRDQQPGERFTLTGESRTFSGNIDDVTKPVRITLAWTDAPGSTTGNAFNNDLDLTVTIDGTTYRGNVFSGATSIAGGVADVRNNVESVFLPAGTSGAYAVTVTAANINSDGVPGNSDPLDQDFALVISNVQATPLPSIAKAGATLVEESCLPGNGVIDANELVTFSFALENIGTLDTTNLVATLVAADGVTAPSGSQSYGVVPAGGASVEREFTFLAGVDCGEGIIATLVLTDDGAPLGVAKFNLTTGVLVAGVTSSFGTGGAVTIRDANTALPYPSEINVSGLSGFVHNVKVKLTGLTHTWGGDIDAMLVAPDGSSMMLMSDVVEAATTGSVTVTFDDDAATSMTTWTTGTYRPTNGGGFGNDVMPAPAPQTPGSTLSDLDGGVPNGIWKLFIRDDGNVDSGSLTSWTLEITTAQMMCCVSSDALFTFDDAVSTVAEGSGSFTATVVRSGNPAASSVRITSSNATATAGSDYNSVDQIVSFALNQMTKSVVIPILDDLDDENDEGFVLTLSAPSANGELGNPSVKTVTISDDDDPAFTISSITPNNGSHLGGTLIELTGTGFEEDATYTVGGVAATSVDFNSATSVTLEVPALAAGALHDVRAANLDGNVAKLTRGWLADFHDVPQAHLFHDFVESIFRFGITAGCGGGNYCPSNAVTREQMAVFLLVAKNGINYLPPAPTLPGFADVPPASPFKAWIEALATAGITAGCGGGNYCPSNPVTREQMAVFLLVTKEGTSYVPPAATGVFTDVAPSNPFRPWIEELFARGITSGCGVAKYCPSSPNTRGEMAVFLKVTFALP